MRVSRVLPALALAAALSGPAAAQTSALESFEPQPYTVLSQSLTSVLEEFGASVGLPMVIDEMISGRVEDVRGEMTPREFLDRVTGAHGLVWYHDGTAIHVTPASANRSLMIDFDTVSPEQLRETFESLDIADDRFPVRSTGEQGVGVLTGPPRLVELAQNAFTLLERRQAATVPAATPGEPPVQVSVPRRTDILVIRGDDVRTWQGRHSPSDASAGDAAAAAEGSEAEERPAAEADDP